MVKIAVVAIKKIALNAYLEQVKDFFGEEAIVLGYAIEDNPAIIQGDVILMTSYFLFNTVKRRLANKDSEIIHISGTFSRSQIDQIKKIPPYSKVLVVNSSKEVVYDCIMHFEHIIDIPMQYIAYSEIEDKQIDSGDYEYAVTFIETFNQNDKVKNVIKLGSRKIHPYIFEHVMSICFKENCILAARLSEYRKNMISINFSVVDSMNVVKEWEGTLNRVIHLTDKGVIILDDNNEIKGLNDYVCDLFNVNKVEYYGSKIDEIPGFFEIFEDLCRMREETDVRLYCHLIEQYVIASKKIIQFYSYGFLTLLFIEISEKDLNSKKIESKARFYFSDIIGECECMRRTVAISKQVSYSDSAVLLTGETGTGKELFAHAIHNHSQRKNMPFIAVNCAAFPESLLESELFGYEPGTFTGALKGGKKGIFEIAAGGTVFLDEIGDAPMSIQAKLLRVLQEKEIRRIGGEVNIPVNVRILSATNKDLRKRIEEDQFRKDLYYRLNTFNIKIPSLKERTEDIEMLVLHFLRQNKYSYKKVSERVLELLKSNVWDGNLRELKNCVDYMAFMSGDIITEEFLADEYKNNNGAGRIEKNDLMRENKGILSNLAYQDCIIAEFLIKELYYCAAGRDKLLLMAEEKGIILTEHHLKRILRLMRELNLISQKKGRGGVVLTEEGIKLFQKLFS